ncbi:transporter [Halobacterium litoreum]|uniref:Transporter n=1 Tax=Halobacterium litoreum TaxID=2039234 RepID=A0ABD5ND58_9EURY|nr:transporter [Halobacterium litoreum]UHH14050.1 transporter [Halobacterium litoreum]
MSTRTLDRNALGTGAVAGVLAYALGYVVTYLWQSSSVENALDGYNFVASLFGGDPIPTWQGVGWLFYNAHAVAFTHPGLGGGRVARNFIADGNAPQLLYLLPPLVLVLTGFVLARAANAPDGQTGARAGVQLASGYFVLAVVGLFAFQYSSGGSSIHVDYVLGVVLAGLLYPLAFGAAGGALAGATS